VTTMAVADLAKQEFLRAVYELTEMKAKHPIALCDAQHKAGHSNRVADEACGFWADHGILEYPSFNKVALTHVGLRRASRLAAGGWQLGAPF
jgi:hypothetical protein